MIALVDSGSGNLRSVHKALEQFHPQVRITQAPTDLLSAEKIVLPGVGAFRDGMRGLETRGLVAPIVAAIEKGIPLLGICVGMQVLFEGGEEHGFTPGLGLLPGRVRRFPDTGLKIPQTGWNTIEPQQKSILFDNLQPESYAYFNHGYYCDAEQLDVLASTQYGKPFASIVGRGRLYGVQFHPEKSQQVGLTILKNFVELG
jgi:imidazole glycerol-phosphate synthase subunit HisH